ncbi:hypothetical protein AB0C38_24820 [Amycolatopsis sp. NPDC048633]|uniref:hypothetical protein n=1 Tax=Amycolatopsis sp. NPDC048633 TaxID=3157095 RepID=UPI0033CBDC17
MRAWSLLLLLALAACSTAPPAPSPAPAPVKPVNWEEQADWAVRALDPCVLLPSPGTLTSPHACELTLDHGQTMTVEVGGGFNHFARYRSQLYEENGLRVYLSYQPAAGYTPVNCRLAVPLAPTRAVWLTVSGGADYRRECDIARPTMRSITAKLRGDVAALAAGHEPRTRWRACEPLARVLGRAPADPTMDAIRDTRVGDPSQADDCEWGDYRFAGRRLTFTLGTVPEEGAPVRVGTVPARLTDYQGTCVLIWAPTGTTPLATLRGGCAGLTDVATKIQTLLGGPPPPVPPAPAGLGIPRDQSDEPAIDPACLVSAVPPADCRAHKQLPVPAGGVAILKAAATPDGVDLACTLLADAIRSATGRDGQVAYTGLQCLGTTADRNLDFRFKLDPASNLSRWDPRNPRITVAGFPAMTVDLGTARMLLVSDTHDEQGIGRVHLETSTTAPLGEATPERPTDPARLALGDRVAAALLARF